MAVLLAIMAGALLGAGDFGGGVAARRTQLINVVLWSHLIGLIGVALLAPWLADTVTTADLAWGATGGLFGLVGVLLLYRGLARGPMAVVAPLSAITSAVVPLTYGLATGDQLSGLAVGGIICGLAAIVLISSERSTHDRAPVTVGTVVEALLAGAGFGTFFVFLSLTDEASAPWPVVGARVATTMVMAVVAWRVRPSRPPPGVGPYIVMAGVFDTAANVAFQLAAGRGQLSVVAVLASLYPASTVLLAWVVLREQISRLRLVGLGLAAVAIGLVGFG